MLWKRGSTLDSRTSNTCKVKEHQNIGSKLLFGRPRIHVRSGWTFRPYTFAALWLRETHSKDLINIKSPNVWQYVQNAAWMVKFLHGGNGTVTAMGLFPLNYNTVENSFRIYSILGNAKTLGYDPVSVKSFSTTHTSRALWCPF